MPVISREFNSLKDVGWYSSVYFMTLCISQLLYGKLNVHYPIQWSYSVAMLLFLVGSAVCGAAPNSPALIVGRAIAGLGSSGILIGTFSLIPYLVVPIKRPLFTGLVGGTMGLGAALGPLIGGAFTEHVSWRWNVCSIDFPQLEPIKLTGRRVVLHKSSNRSCQLCHLPAASTSSKAPYRQTEHMEGLCRDTRSIRFGRFNSIHCLPSACAAIRWCTVSME